MTPLFHCKIKGRVRIKKNSRKMIRRGGRNISIPSDAFKDWELEAAHIVNLYRGPKFQTITEYCTAIYKFNFKDKRSEADTSNCVEGVADVLESCGVILNDKLIKNFYAEKFFTQEDSAEVYILPYLKSVELYEAIRSLEDK